MPDMDVWPTDGAAGSVSSELRWRKMARLWTNTGVENLATLTPTLAAGPVVNVTAGRCWVDGHLCELTAPAAVPVTAGPGILVVRFTPADNHAELVYRDGVSVPTQTDATFEMPLILMSGGSMFERRALAIGAEALAVATADFTVSTINPTYGIMPGTQVVLWGPGMYEITMQVDMDVRTLAAGNIAYVAPQYSGAVTEPFSNNASRRGFTDMGTVRRDVRTYVYPIQVTAPASAVLNIGAAKGTSAGVFVLTGVAGTSWLHARRIG